MNRTLFVQFFICLLITQIPELAWAKKTDPLFDSSEELSISISSTFSDIYRQRDKSRRYPAQIQLENELPVDVELQVRGNNRLKKQICDYPPLKVFFKKKNVDNTLFRKQRELKLVVACKRKYAEHVRIEYLVYKAFSLVSDNSFNVRWLDLSFVEGKKIRQSPGFFIEQKKRMGKRLALTQVQQNRISPNRLDPRAAATVDLFQFMIGNTDYSNMKAPASENCCHNIKLMAQKTQPDSAFIPIPYDFDNSGLVNVAYAVPPAVVGTQSVTSRRYRGLCMFSDHLPDIIDTFNTKQSDLIALFLEDPLLQKHHRSKTAKYLAGFFDILNAEKKLDRFVTSACRS